MKINNIKTKSASEIKKSKRKKKDKFTRHEQVCLMRLRIADDGRSISDNVPSLCYIMNTEQANENIFRYLNKYVCISENHLSKIKTNGRKYQYLINRK